MIVFYLRSCICGNSKKTGFSYIRKSNKTYVSKQLKFEDYISFLSLVSCFSKVWCLSYRVFEVDITLTSFTTLSSNEAFSILLKIVHQKSGLGIENHSSDRNLDNQILTFFAVAFFLHAVLTTLSFVFLLVSKVHQSSKVSISKENYVSAVSTVSTVRTTFRDKGFSSK